MTSPVKFTSQIGVQLVESMGSDLSVVNAARVSVGSAGDEMGEKDVGLIGFLMRNRHASPFEHVQATFLIDAPIFVAREWHRHRTQSFNEVSGRYKELEPRFYVPHAMRPLEQVGKPGAYEFTLGSDEQFDIVEDAFEESCTRAWSRYQTMLDAGIAKEVARMVLPVNIYTKWYATANLRNWLNFLSLRAEANAMYEIRQAAYRVEKLLRDVAPVTMAQWEKERLPL